MSDQWTILTFDGQESPAFPVMTGIPQDSSLSLILFLFYNMELLERCANPCDEVRCLGFMDDVTLFAWEKFIKNNCQWLAEAHAQCD